VRIEGPGFKTIEFKDVALSADSDARVDGQFAVGSASEQVELTAESEQLKTDRADVSIEFNEKYVEDLPIMNRTSLRSNSFRRVHCRKDVGARPCGDLT